MELSTPSAIYSEPHSVVSNIQKRIKNRANLLNLLLESILNLLLSPKSSISSILNPAVTSQILSILSNNATEIAQNSTILSFLSTDTIAALQNSTTEAVTGLLSTLNSTVESLASPKFVEALLHLGAQAGSNNTQLIDLVGTLTTALGL